MSTAYKRTAFGRAEFFLELAEQCTSVQRDEFEAYLEACIVFARSALLRLKTKYEKHPQWKAWFEQLNENSSVNFFRNERNFVLKESSSKIGQRIGFKSTETAAAHYFYDDYSLTAAQEVRQYLEPYKKTLLDGEEQFKDKS